MNRLLWCGTRGRNRDEEEDMFADSLAYTSDEDLPSLYNPDSPYQPCEEPLPKWTDRFFKTPRSQLATRTEPSIVETPVDPEEEIEQDIASGCCPSFEKSSLPQRDTDRRTMVREELGDISGTSQFKGLRTFKLRQRLRKAFDCVSKPKPTIEYTRELDDLSGAPPSQAARYDDVFSTTIEYIQEHGAVYNQLMVMGREIDAVLGDGNCMFESVARQLNKPGMNHVYLRKLTCDHADKYAEIFMEQLGMDEASYKESVCNLRNDKVWNESAGDIAFDALQFELGRKIVLIQNNQPPMHFPDDGKPRDGYSIVVARDDVQEHYDSTLPLDLFSDGTDNYGTVEAQLAKLGRKLENVPRDGNALSKSIIHQLHELQPHENTSRELRFVVQEHVNQFKDTYANLLNISQRSLLERLERFMEEPFDGPWCQEAGEIVATFFQLSDKKIVFIRNFKKPLSFPDDDSPIDKETVVIAEDDCNGTELMHYNGSSLKLTRRLRNLCL